MFRSKKILAAILLLIAAAPIFFFAGFLFKQKIIRHEMKEKLEGNFLQTITVGKADFKWVKKNKEIIIDGRLFDVKGYRIKNDSLFFTGLYDEAEQKLKKDFAGILQQKKNETAPLEQLILKLILTAVVKKNTEAAFLSLTKSVKTIFPVYNEVAVTQSIAVNTPPPNV